jgi:ABC-2 type transport system permease protein
VLFWKLISVSIRSQMQYPGSFVMLSLSHFIGTFVDILGIWILFDRFHMVKGWTLPEVGLIYGIIQMGFALAEASSRGFDTFSQLIKQGDFDRLLLRPLSPLFQVAVREVHAMRIGRFLQGFVVLVWSSNQLSLSLFSLHALTICLSVLGTGCLFYGLFVIQAAISFWTIEALELMNIATYGGVQSGQYPLSIYDKTFRLIFTVLIPIGCVAYYPIAILLRRELFPIWLALLFPLTGLLFLYLACQLWHLGVRRYRSTGS